MQTFMSAALQFPTIVFALLLILGILYWLLVLLRLAPLELFERDSLRDDHMASTLVSLGFAGVPASLALSLLVLLAGAISLAVELLVLRWLPLGMLRVPVGVLVLWASFAVASPLAAAVCHALQRGLHRYPPFQRRCLLGATAVVAERDQQGGATARLLMSQTAWCACIARRGIALSRVSIGYWSNIWPVKGPTAVSWSRTTWIRGYASTSCACSTSTTPTATRRNQPYLPPLR